MIASASVFGRAWAERIEEVPMGSLDISSSDRLPKDGRLFWQFGWWMFFLICVFYSGYAFVMAAVEVLFRLGIAGDAPHRGVPLVFVAHAVAGGVVLISGALQLNPRLLQTKRKLHHVLGRIYVGTIWISSIGGLWLTLFFDVTVAAKVALGLLSILWFSTTTIALWRIRSRRVAAHREWMQRSVALSFFFVTFSLWVPGLASTNLPETVSYPLAIFLSWGLNLLVVELWIRRNRPQIASMHA
jgi:hypothetical protein